MNEPWGISGPQFLTGYWFALGSVVLVTVGLRLRIRAGQAREPHRVLRVHEVAYLAGGPRRTVEASVAHLIESGALRPSRDGTVQVTGEPGRGELDAAVLEDAALHSRRTVRLLLNSVAEGPVVATIGHQLVELGLLVDPQVARRRRRLTQLLVLSLFLVGFARWVNGVSLGRPIGWLTLLLVITGLILLLLGRHPRNQRTFAGKRALDRVTDSRQVADDHDVVPLAGAAGLVALGGLAVFPDATIRSAITQASTTPYSGGFWSGGGGGGCSTSGSSGSSCGGGSSGGGCGG